MLFNSLEFALFLPIVFAIYWLLRNQLKLQNLFVVLASYVFYGWWDWRFLILIAFTSFCSWGSGLLIERANVRSSVNPLTPSPLAKFWMVANIVLNLGILATFKYYDFFVTEFITTFFAESVQPSLLHSFTLKVILPVGISFYTFQALSYSIDVYRKKIEPTRDIVAFFAYVAFFPQLVAGPIERATNLLPQFLQKRTFNYEQGVDGMRQILWGLFKKIVVADNCAMYVDQVWSTYDTQSGSTLLLAAILFTFQIYGDFSGYSDIAIGTAKLFGIKLMRNFNNPYFSRDIAEFWRRWHISLTTWFRDYVYIPLGGSRVSKVKIVRNTFVIFLLSGFWHGANWTFIAWGAYHAVLFLPLILLGMNRKYTNQVAEGRWLPTWKETGQILLTFMLAVIGWIIFRAETITQAWDIFGNICSSSLLSIPYLKTRAFYLPLFASIAFMLLIEWLNRDYPHGLARVTKRPWLNVLFYYALIVVMYWLSVSGNVQFIYFQF